MCGQQPCGDGPTSHSWGNRFGGAGWLTCGHSAEWLGPGLSDPNIKDMGIRDGREGEWGVQREEAAKLSWPHPHQPFLKVAHTWARLSPAGGDPTEPHHSQHKKPFRTNPNSDNHFGIFPAMLRKSAAGKTWTMPVRLEISISKGYFARRLGNKMGKGL